MADVLTATSAFAGIALVAVNAALWWAYRATAKEEGIVPLARRVIGENSLTLHLVGHGLQQSLRIIAADRYAGHAQHGALPGVMGIYFGDRDVELMAQAGDE